MKTFLFNLWEKFRTSFLFVPGVMVAGFAGLALASLEIDRQWGDDFIRKLPGLSQVSPDGVRSLLSTTATSVLALAGVTFSATLVALTLASGQYGSRILRNFIRALPIQLTLGILPGTFLFCLIVLRSVRGAESIAFVPHVATLIAFLATMASLLAFMYFVHYIATSLQAERIVRGVFDELSCSIRAQFPGVEGKQKSGDPGPSWDESTGEEYVIECDSTGYLQASNIQRLIKETAGLGTNARCRVLALPGDFLSPGQPLVAISGSRPLDDDVWKECFIAGQHRTPEQDYEHCIRQLVEIGLRALSPGINDPFTAMHCIDYLGAAMAEVSRRELPQWEFRDDDGKLRVQTRAVGFSSILGTAFDQLRQAARGKPDVVIRILEAFERIARSCRTQEARASVEESVHQLEESIGQESFTAHDSQCLEAGLDRVRKQLAA